MINYYFDNTNELKAYTFQAEANEGTLPPANALRIAPEFKEGFHPCIKDNAWILVEDNRDKTVYDIETKEPVIIDYLGPIKDRFTLLEPFEFSKWDGKKWVLNKDEETAAANQQNQSKKNNLLSEANQQVAILQDAVDLDMAEDEDENKLKEWKKYRILLNRVDVNLLDIEWPQKPI